MAGTSTIVNPNGAFGVDGTGTTENQRFLRLESEHRASAAIAKGRLTQIAANGTVATAATDASHAVFGFASKALAAGESGGIIVGGFVENVPHTGTVNVGDTLIRSASTAGSVAAGATGHIVGIARAAGADGVVPLVEVIRQLNTTT